MTVDWLRTVAPTASPVTLEDAKDFCRISHDDEDALVQSLIAAAVEWVEHYTRRALATQTYRVSLSEWPTDGIALPYATPLQSITSVTYYDGDNAQQTLSSANYLAITTTEPGRLDWIETPSQPTLYARPDAVQILYVAGQSDVASVPAALSQAVLMLVAHWHANRETVLVGAMSKELEFAVTALCSPYRLFWSPPC